PGGARARPGDLPARSRRPLVRSRRSLRPHPHLVLRERGWARRPSSISTRTQWPACAARSLLRPAAGRACVSAARVRTGSGARRPSGGVSSRVMRFAIDGILLGADLQGLGVREELGPWRAAGRRRARAVLELPAGEGRRRGLAAGTRLALGSDEELR